MRSLFAAWRTIAGIVIPAQAGIQSDGLQLVFLDSGSRNVEHSILSDGQTTALDVPEITLASFR